jgi:hypothetical protein
MCTSNPNPKTTIHGWFDETSSSFSFQLLMKFIKISDPSAIDCMMGFCDPWDQQTPTKKKACNNGYEFQSVYGKGIVVTSKRYYMQPHAQSSYGHVHIAIPNIVLLSEMYCVKWNIAEAIALSLCAFVIMVYRAITTYTHMVSKFAKLYWTSFCYRF